LWKASLRKEHRYFRAAREAAEDEKTTVMREAREVVSILKETAKRRMQAESLKGGMGISVIFVTI
jgi:CHASE3 domain sensor protein